MKVYFGDRFGARVMRRRATVLERRGTSDVKRATSGGLERRYADVRTRGDRSRKSQVNYQRSRARTVATRTYRATRGVARRRAGGVTRLSGSVAVPPPPASRAPPFGDASLPGAVSRCSPCPQREGKCRRAVDGACRAASEQPARETSRQSHRGPGTLDSLKSGPA